MHGFKKFILEMDEREKDVLDTLSKLPKKYRNLVKGFKFKWEAGHTLKDYPGHVGLIDPKTKTITIAASFNYSRNFIFLHELAHIVYNVYCTKKWKDLWAKTVVKHKDRQKQNDEELFCHNFASYFANHQIVTHDHPAWVDYMDKFVKATS